MRNFTQARMTVIAFYGIALLAVAGAPSDADSPLPGPKSGLQVGEKVPTFYVRAITGPLQSKSVCYVCRNGDRPVVMVLVRDVTPELKALLKGIDELVDAHRAEGLRSFGVFIARDSKALLPAVQTLAFEEKLNLPLTISAASVEGATGQNLHPDAVVTVVLYRDQKVTANFTFSAGKLTGEEIARVLDAVRRLAEGKEPEDRG
jgi:hypothetical protein